MFSSSDLISFVFANENDTYYRDDLLKLNQDQQLWHLLHESFDTVYFLRNTENQLQVYSFGDSKGGPCPVFKDKIFTSAEEQLGNWMLRQLRGKTGCRVAVVCSMTDFCDVMSKKQWEKPLREIEKEPNRTGILVLTASATAERNTELLLSSPVFDYLKESAVTEQRDGNLRELYEYLADHKCGSCFFLNEFLWERVHALLLHVMMEYPDRMKSMEDLDRLTDYLHNYLNASVTAGNDPLFESALPRYYLTYREIYTKLCKEQIWDRLEARAEKDNKTKQLNEKKPILRDRNAYAGRCMQLKLPSWIDLDTDEGVRVFRMMREIREMASVPKNRLENTKIQEIANDFLKILDAVPSDDPDSYKASLFALKLCLERMHTDPEHPKAEQLLNIMQYQKELLSVLRQSYAMEKNLKSLLLQDSKHAIHSKTVSMLQAELLGMKKMRGLYEEFIQTAVWELSAPDTERSAERLKTLVEKLEVQRQKNIQQLEADQRKEKVEQIPPPEKKSANFLEEDVELRPEDANYIPPSY